MEPIETLRQICLDVTKNQTLKKLVLSRPANQTILRTEGHLFEKKGETFLQLETFTTDGKALHRNIPVREVADTLISVFADYRQLNLITTGGDMEARRSSKGKLLLSGKLKAGARMDAAAHDRQKKHILYEGIPYDFLIALGVTDQKGMIFDKKRAKFRQIDRFLQYINEITPKLPKNDELYVLDLCCGKSYLTFAAYWFLTAVKGRKVAMLGADRKTDVIAYCTEVAKTLGYEGLTFRCCDITELTPDRRPALVLSLHACDIATDIVLTTAARLEADVILSTPCCHHQVFEQLSGSSPLSQELSPILQHSLLKQKLAVALTDALRCKRLEAAGYTVDVTELIDPENTPKNLMIRAIRTPMTEANRKQHEEEFRALEALAGIRIFGS